MPSSTTQFRPGQSGNPGGRPRRKAITDLLRERLDDGATAGAIVDAWIAAMLAGDIAALKEALNRIEGKVPDRLTLADDSRPPRINLRAPSEPEPEPEPEPGVFPIRAAEAV